MPQEERAQQEVRETVVRRYKREVSLEELVRRQGKKPLTTDDLHRNVLPEGEAVEDLMEFLQELKRESLSAE